MHSDPSAIHHDVDGGASSMSFTDEDLKLARKVLENLLHYPKLYPEPKDLRHDLRVVAEAIATARETSRKI